MAELTLRLWKDQVSHRLMILMGLMVLFLGFFIGGGLLARALPVLQHHHWDQLLFSSQWHPTQGQFGLGAFIAGTLWVTFVAILIAVPLSVLTAMFLSEYCPSPVRLWLKPGIELLAGISPVVYGVWGMLVIVPLVRDYLMPFFSEHFPFFPFVSENYTGFSALTAGIVLAVMVSPLIISLLEEIMHSVSFGMRVVALALGATKWQMVKTVVLRKVSPGMVAAIILGFSRAMGETMAVLMVAGCAMGIFPHSLFDTAYPLPALIANTYGEMMSVPLYDAAILLAALVLFILTVAFNMIAWGILLYLENREA